MASGLKRRIPNQGQKKFLIRQPRVGPLNEGGLVWYRANGAGINARWSGRRHKNDDLTVYEFDAETR